MPIQLRYLVSFFEMYVLPRAGSPTIDITVGAWTMWGHDAEIMKYVILSVYESEHNKT